MEDPEEFYKEEVEKADSEFLDNLKKGKGGKDLEKKYRERAKKIRAKYDRAIKDLISKQKSKSQKPSPKEKKVKPFKVKDFSIELSWREKLAMRFDLFSFRAKIKIKDLLEKITPGFIIIWRIRTKKFFKRNYQTISKFSEKYFLKKKEQIFSFFKKIKDFFIRLYVNLKAIFAKIKSLFSSIKKIFKKPAPAAAPAQSPAPEAKPVGEEQKL